LGRLEICQLLINHRADVNATDNDGVTALMDAAYKGNLEICKLLINHGADVNAKTNSGWATLNYAVSRENKEIMDLLLSKGANKAGALKCSDLQFWYCVDNGYTNENCIDKVHFTIENFTNSQISSITFMLSIENKEDKSVVYKKRHTIYMQLYPGEKYACDPFPLAQPLYINANEYDFGVEIISAQ
ncbi:MAG TPA: ankyrin repeat domain-containing protein, partial [Candidatus Kapabacteria bacterium]|nr:ankyrin repeat domain-containing protein [Candidatus Kapabacteria bacterium]